MMDGIQVRDLKIDKSDWKLIKFGEVVKEPKESSKNPLSDGIRHVVGLEHIDSEDIHLRRSASIEESTTFTKRFEIGDVLFGRRRAYLKKAAQATFSGICSGDITVFRAKENLMPELLPFIVNNDKFFDYAVKHSAGGLSPRVKFKDLANYEFLLPPKEQQAQLAELLWAMDSTNEQKKHINYLADQFKLSTIENFFSFNAIQKTKIGFIRKDSQLVSTQSIATSDKYSCVGGPFGSNLTSKHYVSIDGVPVIRGVNLSGVETSFNDDEFVFVSNEKADTLSRNLAFPGDIVVTQRGTLGQVALIPEDSKYPRYVVSQSQMKLTVDKEKIRPKYYYYYFQSQRAQRYLDKIAIATGVPHINLQIFREFPVILPSLELQDFFIDKVEAIERTKILVKKNTFRGNQLLRSLINQIF